MGGGGGKQHGEDGGWRSERCLVAVRVWGTENVANAMSCSQYGALVPGVSNNRMQTDKRLLRVRPREFSTGPFTGSFYGSVYGVLQRVRVCGDSTGPCMGFFYGSVCGLLLRVRVRALSMGPCTGSSSLPPLRAVSHPRHPPTFPSSHPTTPTRCHPTSLPPFPPSVRHHYL